MIDAGKTIEEVRQYMHCYKNKIVNVMIDAGKTIEEVRQYTHCSKKEIARIMIYGGKIVDDVLNYCEFTKDDYKILFDLHFSVQKVVSFFNEKGK